MTGGPRPEPAASRGGPDPGGDPGLRTPVVAIIGGGIAGLAAAFYLRDEPVRVTVLEGSPRLGGKLAVSPVAGIEVDAGAEALLARRPEGVGLLAELGLESERRDPGTTSAGIRCSVSTDDPAMFGTDLGAEYRAAAQLGVSPRDCYQAGVAGALCGAATLEELRITGQNAAWPPAPLLAGGSS